MADKQVVRFGVIGVGGMGSGHCSYFEKFEEGVLVAVVDVRPERAKEIGEQYKVPYFTDTESLIKAKLCDAVVIATPHPERPAIAIACMRAGLHVLAEKPLAERVSAADEMIRTAKETGVAFGVVFQRRTEPVLAKAIAIAQSGELGKLHRITMISPEYRSQAYYDSGGWRATWKGEGGGVMMNQSPHILDLFILIGGMPESIYARVEARLHNIEVEDVAEAMVSYPGGGTGFFYCSTNEAGPGQMIEMFGDNGKLLYRNGELKLWKYDRAVTEFTKNNTAMWGSPKCVEVPVEIPEGDSGHWVISRNFCRHILHGEALIAPGGDGIRSLELANAAWLSSDQGKRITLPISRADYDAFKKRKIENSTFVKTVKSQTVLDPNHKA